MLRCLLIGILYGAQLERGIDLPLPSPATEVRAAAEDMVLRVPPADRPFVRWLSFYNYPISNQIRYRRRKSTRFTLNSLSLRPDIVFPYDVPPHPWMEPISGTLVRIDLRDFGWTPAQWEELVPSEPYFGGRWVDHLSWHALNKGTLSAAAVMRADWFVRTITTEPHYSKFFRFPETLDQLKQKFAVDEKVVETFSLDSRGAVINSLPGLNNRQLIRLQGPVGYFWVTLDVLRNDGERAALDRPFGITKDGGEIIWKLPNGLQAYYLVNAQDQRVDEVPPGIAVDYVTGFKEKTVKNMRSCVRCHVNGINTFRSDITHMINEGKIRLYSRDHDKALKLSELYSSRIYRLLKQDQESYIEAVERCTGWSVDENARAFEEMLIEYAEPAPFRGITVERACRELGISPEELIHFIRVVSAYRQDLSGTLGAIGLGTPVKIDAWEQVFPLLAAQVYTEKQQAKLLAVGLSPDPHARIGESTTAQPQNAAESGQGGSQ